MRRRRSPARGRKPSASARTTPARTSRKCGARRTCARTRKRSSSREAPGAGGPLSRSALRFEREAHADGAEAVVDIEDLARDSGGQVRAEEGGGVAHVLEGDVAAERGDFRHPGEHLPKAWDPGRREGLDGARGDAVDP